MSLSDLYALSGPYDFCCEVSPRGGLCLNGWSHRVFLAVSMAEMGVDLPDIPELDAVWLVPSWNNCVPGLVHPDCMRIAMAEISSRSLRMVFGSASPPAPSRNCSSAADPAFPGAAGVFLLLRWQAAKLCVGYVRLGSCHVRGKFRDTFFRLVVLGSCLCHEGLLTFQLFGKFIGSEFHIPDYHMHRNYRYAGFFKGLDAEEFAVCVLGKEVGCPKRFLPQLGVPSPLWLNLVRMMYCCDHR